MKIEINPKPLNDDRRNLYFIELEFMSGDADGDEIVEFEIKPEQLEELLPLLEKMRKDERHNNEDYWESIRENESFDYDTSITLQVIENWPIDSTCSDYYASFEKAQLFYYDENCAKHSVKVDGKEYL